MITIEPLEEWKERQDLEVGPLDCRECGGLAECECCSRECLVCGGSGITGNDQLADREVEARYFNEVMESLKRLCAFSTRHDFLTEVGDFIKAHGRLDLPPWERQPIRH